MSSLKKVVDRPDIIDSQLEYEEVENETKITLSEGKPTRHIVDWHPGRGKTRRVIVELAQQAVKKQRKILILAPTRVVKEEIKRALYEKGVNVGDTASSIRMRLVTVMCHATWMTLLLKNPRLKNLIKYIVMDEAHFQDPMSMAARGVMDTLHFEGQASVWYLTATPPGATTQCDSNYPITDIEKNLSDRSLKKLLEAMAGEKRSLVFLPTKSECDKYSREMGGYSLHRDNFDVVYPKLKKLSQETFPKFTFSTDISELGANLPITTVIDTKETVKPMLTDTGVELIKQKITISSMNQRRGRVGRTVEGEYISHDVGELPCVHENYVGWVEAQMVMDQFLGVKGMVEEQIHFQDVPGHYTLNDRKKEKFLNLILESRFEVPIWLAWKIANDDAEGTSWLMGGRDVVESVGKIPSGVYEGEFPRPRFMDARFFRKDMQKNFIQYVNHSKSMRSMPFNIIFHVGPWIYKLIDEASAFWTMDYMTNLQRERSMNAITTLMVMTILILVVFVMCMVSMCCCSRNVTYPSGKGGFSTLTYAFLLLLAALYYGVNTSMVLALAFVLLLAIPAIEASYSNYRSTPDYIFLILLVMLGGLVTLIVAYEYDMTPRTFALLGSLWNVRGSVAYSPLTMSTPLASAGLHATLATFGILMVLAQRGGLNYLEDQYSNLFLQRVTKDCATPLSSGFPILKGLNVRAVVAMMPCLISGGIWDYVTGAFVASIIGYVVYSQDEKEVRAKYSNLAISLDRRGELPDGFRTWFSQLEGRTNIRAIIYCGNALLVLFAMVSHNYAVPTAIQGAWPLIASLAVALDLPVVTQWFHMPMTTCIAAIASVEAFHFGVGGIILYMLLANTSANVRSMLNEIVITSGHIWKKRLNALNKKEFDSYRSRGVDETPKGDYVSRSALKLREFQTKGLFSPEGEVVDLGSGRGGWSQHVALHPRVTRVKAFTLGMSLDSREVPVPNITFGHNLVESKAGVDVFCLEPFQCDTVMCDIGESDPNAAVEAVRTLRSLKLLTSWLKVSPRVKFVWKILSPYDSEVLKELRRVQAAFDCSIYRSSYSRNSSAEMYLVSGPRSNLMTSIMATIKILLSRFGKKNLQPNVGEPILLRKGTRATVNIARKNTMSRIQTRLNRVKREFSNTWKFDSNNPYRTFNYHGSYLIKKISPGGQIVNSLFRMALWPWEGVYGVTKFMMTDISSRSQQAILREKVDTQVPPLLAKFRIMNRTIMLWIASGLKKRGLVPRQLTPEDFLENVRNDASVGGWCAEVDWESAEEAVRDPRFWDMVDRERALHLHGDCELCIYNTMGKKEKKPAVFGLPKGSRTIWYLWLGGRYLEYEALGFLNQDHWVSRENLLCGEEEKVYTILETS